MAKLQVVVADVPHLDTQGMAKGAESTTTARSVGGNLCQHRRLDPEFGSITNQQVTFWE